MLSRHHFSYLLVTLLAILCAIFLISLMIGPVTISFIEIIKVLLFESDAENHVIIWQIRLPRALLALSVGALLALSGVGMQSLFRNPLADPSLIGVSSGASVGAGIAIVLISQLSLPLILQPYFLSLCAFIGGLLATLLVYQLGKKNGYLNISTMLLAGVAITALAGAGIGLLSFIADDTTLRKLLFWNTGSLNGATFTNVMPIIVITLCLMFFLYKNATNLNAFLLGESEAYYLGISVKKLKFQIIVLSALAVATSVAVVGLIGFVGLIIPHLSRLLVGANHTRLLPIAAILGAILLLLADIFARMIFSPADLPIGIVTAILGAPFFLYLLMKKRM